jgi:hypothetical protein
VVGIVDVDHVGVALNRGLGALADKDDDLFNGPGGLVLQVLLNDVFTDGTPNDGKVYVS